MTYFSLKQTAEVVGISYARLHHYCAIGKLTPELVGGRKMFADGALPAVRQFFAAKRPNRKRRPVEGGGC